MKGVETAISRGVRPVIFAIIYIYIYICMYPCLILSSPPLTLCLNRSPSFFPSSLHLPSWLHPASAFFLLFFSSWLFPFFFSQILPVLDATEESTAATLHKYTCMYVCIYVCLYVGMYVCMYVCMYIQIEHYRWQGKGVKIFTVGVDKALLVSLPYTSSLRPHTLVA